jgi:hypothetical protein
MRTLSRRFSARLEASLVSLGRLRQYLESFSADHLHLKAEEVFELFVARLSRGLAASTLLTYTTIMRTYGVRPFGKDAVERRIRARSSSWAFATWPSRPRARRRIIVAVSPGHTWRPWCDRGQQTTSATRSGGLLCGCSW